jgi:hypothetical protein
MFMKTARQTRRNLILFTTVFLLGSGFLHSAAAEEPVNTSTRPAGSCPAWTDKDNSGFCDRSENGSKPCKRTKCPAHVNNP